MDLKTIKSLTEQKRYDDALAACELLLQEIPERTADILRSRASVFVRIRDYERALQDRQSLFKMGEGTIADYYLAADNALSARKFAEACGWLSEVLRLGEEQGETWFKAGAYFLLAYAQMELGQYKDAIATLDHAVAVEVDIAMPLPGMCGICSHQQLREKIIRREIQRT